MNISKIGTCVNNAAQSIKNKGNNALMNLVYNSKLSQCFKEEAAYKGGEALDLFKKQQLITRVTQDAKKITLKQNIQNVFSNVTGAAKAVAKNFIKK